MSTFAAQDWQARRSRSGSGRRQSPRVHIELAAKLRLASDRVVAATVRDLSLHGLGIRTDGRTAGAVHPTGRVIRADEGPVFDALLDLPLGAGSERFLARCRVRTFALEKDGGVRFGLEFRHVPIASARVLLRFIEEALVPAY